MQPVQVNRVFSLDEEEDDIFDIDSVRHPNCECHYVCVKWSCDLLRKCVCVHVNLFQWSCDLLQELCMCVYFNGHVTSFKNCVYVCVLISFDDHVTSFRIFSAV